MFQWNDKQDSRFAKANGLEIINLLKSKEHGGVADMIIVGDDIEGDDDDDKKNNNMWWNEFGGSQQAEPQVSTITSKPSNIQKPILYRIANTKDRNKMITVAQYESPLASKGLLNSNNSFVLECNSEIFVWIGKTSNAQQCQLAILVASKIEKTAGIF